jgi:hypothetical protein
MDILPRRSYITDVSRTSVAGTETTRAYSKNAALISNVEGFIDQEASNITNSTVLQGNNPFASNFERSLENGTDVRTNRPFTFTPPNQTTVTRPRNNNPFASNFERTFNLNVGG